MRNKATKKNMDLDLRRYGNKLYSKAEQHKNSGEEESGDNNSLSIEFIEQVLAAINSSEGFIYDNSISSMDGFSDDWIDENVIEVGNKTSADYIIWIEKENELGDYITTVFYLTSEEKNLLDIWMQKDFCDFKKHPPSFPIDTVLKIEKTYNYGHALHAPEISNVGDIYIFSGGGFLYGISQENVYKYFGADIVYEPLNTALSFSEQNNEGFVFLNTSYISQYQSENQDFSLESFYEYFTDKDALYGYKIEDNDEYELFIVHLYYTALNSGYSFYTLYMRKK